MDYRTALHNDIASNGLNNQMEVRYWGKILSASLLLILALGSGVQAQAATRITYIHNDHLGTPQVMTDESGTVVWKADYRPFGEADVIVNSLGNDLRFPGQIYDEETGLHYNYFRDYDPGTGRYVQSDPIGFKGGLNTYTFVGSNPLYWIDPYGLEAATPAIPNPGVVPRPGVIPEWVRPPSPWWLLLWSKAAGEGSDIVPPGFYYNEDASGEDSADSGPRKCPTQPDGALKKPKDKWLKGEGVDPHDLKHGIGDSRLDIYVDSKGNIWTLPKDGRGVPPEWQGHLDDFK